MAKRKMPKMDRSRHNQGSKYDPDGTQSILRSAKERKDRIEEREREERATHEAISSAPGTVQNSAAASADASAAASGAVSPR